jgi:hypothetical protein
LTLFVIFKLFEDIVSGTWFVSIARRKEINVSNQLHHSERANYSHWNKQMGSNLTQLSESLDFWTFSTSGILTNYKTFRKLDLVRSSGDGKEIPTLLGLLERDGNKSSFQNSSLSSYLEFQGTGLVFKTLVLEELQLMDHSQNSVHVYSGSSIMNL